VAPGVAGTDAVNMDQLNAIVGGGAAAANAYTDQQVGQLRKQAFQGIAAAAAVVAMTPGGVGETTLNVGAATYGGESALGMAMAHQVSQRVNINGGVGITSGKTLGRVGVGFRF
jgi:autotransporter adhesin